MDVLGVHGEVRCRARISLILDLAKWQHGGGIDLLIIWVIGGLFAKYASLTFRSEKSSLFSVNTNFSLTWTLDLSSLSTLSLSTHTTLSLSLSCTPQPKPGGGSSRAPPQPRAARAGAAHGRARAAPRPRVAWLGGGKLGWPEKRRNSDLGIVFARENQALILNLVPNTLFLLEVKSWVKV